MKHILGRFLAGVGVVGSEQRLVGRDEELKAIADLLDGMDADADLTLQVAGEPGIGKSSLLRELCAGAQARGYLALSGRAAEFEAELPFGVFSDALDDWLCSLDGERLEALAGRAAAELAVVLPPFERFASDPPPGLQEERYRAYRAVRGLLSELAGEVPVVVVLDDVQWADPGSMELVCYLLAHPPRGSVLVALGFRPAQIAPQLNAALAGALRDHRAARIDLAPLPCAAAHSLLGSDLSRAVREELFRQSGGNPFFLLQLARAVTLADRAPAAGTGLTANIPETVRTALASELSSLSAPARVLLQGAAVAGDPFEESLMAAAADVGDADALDLIDELLERQLVSPTATTGRFAFRHPIVRAAVYESAGSGWRARAHARLALLLAERGASASVRAAHIERSARPGDADAVAVLAVAGAECAPRTPALSARWYASALRLLPEVAEAETERIRLLVAMARALGGSGRLEESRGALCQVLDRLPGDDPSRVAVVAYCAGVEHLLGRHRQARARLSQAHHVLVDRASADGVALKIGLATGCFHESRIEEIRSWAEEALEGAIELGSRPLELVAAGMVVYARYALGLPAGAHMDRAAALMDAIDDAELASRLDGGLWIGWTEALLERYGRSIDHCQRAIDLSRTTGQGAFLLGTMSAQAWSLMRTGRLAEADEKLTANIEAFRLAPNAFLPQAVGLSSLLAIYRGDLDAAVKSGKECLRLASSADPGHIRAVSGLHLAMPLMERGEAQRAHDAVLATAGGPDLPLLSRPARCAAYEVLTRADVLLGRLDEAEMWARRADAGTHGGDLLVEAAFARRAMATVVLARGDAPRAAQIALDAAAGAEDAGAPTEAGRCRILGARALVQAGERNRAITELERAAAELARIGADGFRSEAEKELRRLGRRVARRADPTVGSGLRSLTEREREIAELVHRGRTNREIAAASYLSERTVERHLSHIFAKLGVSSRTALASRVAVDGDPGD